MSSDEQQGPKKVVKRLIQTVQSNAHRGKVIQTAETPRHQEE